MNSLASVTLFADVIVNLFREVRLERLKERCDV